MANEKRLIDANVVLAKKFTTGLSDASGNYYGYADVVFADDIENAPTIEADPVIHARWIVNVEFNNGERVIATCSNCKDRGEVRTNRNEWGIWNIDSPYCPNCGAKMDGDPGV